MKANLTQTQINQIFRVQEICDQLRMKVYNNDECKTYIRGYEVDKENFLAKLDCISGSIEDMIENLLEF